MFIFHGSYGYPGENWFPWLKTEVEKLGHETIVPTFPTPEGQNLENWLKTFEPYVPQLDEQSILVGHSCGALFALKLLERINIKIKAVFDVAGPVMPMGNQFDEMTASFFTPKPDWEKIKEHVENIFLLYSDNDPYVAISQGETAARDSGANLHKFHNAGHFNAKAGFTKFPELLELIKLNLEK